MIESDSKTPSVPVLRKLAKVLVVRTSALLGEAPNEDHEGSVNPRPAEVERALYTYRSVQLREETEQPTLAELNERINAGWEEAGEIGEVLRLADEVDVTRIPSLERQTEYLYQVARAYECKGNDTAVFVHLPKAEHLCPEDMQRSHTARSLATTLAKRAKPSYASKVRSSRHGSAYWTDQAHLYYRATHLRPQQPTESSWEFRPARGQAEK